MPTILHDLKTGVRQLRWKLTLSYTAVTVGSLLVVVLALGLLLYSRILIPHNVLTPEVWTQVVQRDVGSLLSYVLAQPNVDTDLVAVTLKTINPQRTIQITHVEPFRIGDIEFMARTVGTGDLLLVGADETLLGTSTPWRFPTARVGQPIDAGLLPGLDEPLRAALAGEEDPERLFVTIQPNKEFFLVVPFFDKQDAQRVLGAAILYMENLVTQSDIPANTATLVSKSLLILLLAAGLVGALFGSMTANGMVKRLQRVSGASEAWSQGDFSEFIEDSAGDEISQLAHRLIRMAEQWQNLLRRRQAMAISEERNRLARDLHDSAKQQALAASFQLGTAINHPVRARPAGCQRTPHGSRCPGRFRPQGIDRLDPRTATADHGRAGPGGCPESVRHRLGAPERDRDRGQRAGVWPSVAGERADAVPYRARGIDQRGPAQRSQACRAAAE
jgi:HAMP domain-containing protein